MSALHARLSGQPGEEVIGLLNDAVDAHFKENSMIKIIVWQLEFPSY